MNNCGIYIIYSELDSRVYIGSSKNIKRRIQRHLSKLKLGKHSNRYLQRFSNKYGIINIKWKLLDICNEDELLELETKRVIEYDSLNYEKGFNLEYPNRTNKTEQSRKNMSEARINSKQNRIVEMYKEDKLIDRQIVSTLSKKYNLDVSSVYKILMGKRKLHKGFSFK